MHVHHPLMRILAVLTVGVLVAVSCSDDDAEDSTESTTTSVTAPETTTTVAETTTTTEAPTTTTEPASTTTPSGSVPVPDAELPGTAFEIAPADGRSIAVVGVRFDDVLNVRLVPGTTADVVAELAPTSADAVATGRARMLSESIWWEVTTADGVIGWVGSSFTAQIGPTSDATAAIIADLGYTPEEASVQDLGFLVADTIDTDPDIPTRIEIVVAADETGDLAEVTLDVIGLGDDAVRGVRLHVFGTPLESGDGFVLKTVEATDLCDPVRGPATPGEICP